MMRLLFLFAAGLVAAPTQAAETYPNRPVHIVVPFETGAPDTVARVLAQQLTLQVGQRVVVDNRPGANGVIGAELVAKAPADGYTLLVTSASFAVNPSIYKKLPFDPLKDFAGITNICSTPGLILGVNPAVAAKSAQELIALGRKSDLSYGSPGVGNTLHLAAALFGARAGINMVHVPYKGAGAVLVDLMSGQVQALISAVPTVLPHIGSNRLRALMVTDEKRSRVLPDIPSAIEAGLPGMVMKYWVGYSVPTGTPQPIVERLNKEIVSAVGAPDARKRFADLGMDAVGNTPAQAAKLVSDEIDRWSAVVKAAGIKVD